MITLDRPALRRLVAIAILNGIDPMRIRGWTLAEFFTEVIRIQTSRLN